MDLGATLNSIMEYNLKEHCHVNSNEDGDRFVGIKADSDEVMVYFPIGYELPGSDDEIRADIKHLIQVLTEFDKKEEHLVALNRFDTPVKVKFPINAFKGVIEYYFSIGGNYYVEKEPVYVTASAGKTDWRKTAKNHIPLVQCKGGVSSLIFTKFEVRSSTPNETKEITQINKFCVYEAFKRLGWLYVQYMPEEPGPHPDVKNSIRIVQNKLAVTNDDRKRYLFRAMRDMLLYIDEETSDRQFYFGTDDFDYVWEKLVDRAFGEKDKDKYFPRSRWLLDYGKNKEQHPLMPDTIMIYDDKYYILDAKCYKYGNTGRPDHLPNSSSINKQITYGEYLDKYKGVNSEKLFNAFIMPYNKTQNKFGLTSNVGSIGEAIGDWRYNRKRYERIQGIVVDTRYLMYNYTGKLIKDKKALAECIEASFEKDRPCLQKRKTNFSFYSYDDVTMVAEPEVRYGGSDDESEVSSYMKDVNT